MTKVRKLYGSQNARAVSAHAQADTILILSFFFSGARIRAPKMQSLSGGSHPLSTPVVNSLASAFGGAAGPIPALDEDYTGPARIETYTVHCDRGGEARWRVAATLGGPLA